MLFNRFRRAKESLAILQRTVIGQLNDRALTHLEEAIVSKHLLSISNQKRAFSS